ncbi:MAG: tRNA pseudouridine(55) synthase TruB [Armatimonadota bacterium]|nr:tRNA pseudouridine(55) synthase TruB [Armatimonadota bacterium]
MTNALNGVLNIDKPAGMTSHDVVGRIRRTARLKRVGHAGTLDPDATGVLLVCLGMATRISDFLADEGKEYRATLALGVTTTTEDASGEVVTRADARHITESDLAEILPRFLGDISQIPPMVSAVHHEGKRLYELARAGLTVERAARTIRIDSLRLLDFTPGELACATLDVACGKGTYIRTLCADLGAALGVGGHMAALRRTRVGAFRVEAATPLDALTEEYLPGLLVSPANALDRLPMHRAETEADEDAIRHGRSLASHLSPETIARILDMQGVLLALGRADGEHLRPFKVFAS